MIGERGHSWQGVAAAPAVVGFLEVSFLMAFSTLSTLAFGETAVNALDALVSTALIPAHCLKLFGERCKLLVDIDFKNLEHEDRGAKLLVAAKRENVCKLPVRTYQ